MVQSNFRGFRIAKGLKQGELAKMFGFSRRSISKFDTDILRSIIQQINVYVEDKIEIVRNKDDFFAVM